jgi:hypothetical protein
VEINGDWERFLKERFLFCRDALMCIFGKVKNYIDSWSKPGMT